jgi:hypothetical protein
MKNKATINLLQKIRVNIPFYEFMLLEEKIKALPEKELGAFWYIYSSGYPTDFALLNCRNLCDYSAKNNISYKEALKIVYTIYPGVNAGIHIKHMEWFELN